MHDHSDDLTRRTFLKALGASMALAGLDGCTRMPAEKILPYVNQPPELTPGIAAHYATSMVLDGYATGLLVEAQEGRPTKIEGNPDHPASLGASGRFEQASLLQLYDPDRATRIRNGRVRASWQAFAAAMAPDTLRGRVGARGARLALLLEPTTSPVIAAQLDALRTMYPDLRLHYYSPLSSNARDAAFMTSGLIPQYDIAAADVILSAGSDFLDRGPFNLRYARAFAGRRRTPLGTDGMNRLYVAECGYSVTGGAADHRLRCTPAELESLLASIAAALKDGSNGAGGSSAWTDAVAADLREHAGHSLVIAGEQQSPRVHALAAHINDLLGNSGRTCWYTQSPALGAADTNVSIASLADALRAGAIDTLVCIGGNPSYATPESLGFSALVRGVPNSVYAGLYENETARDTRWFVPAAHYLETWGDARAYDGTYSLIQPLVQPLHGGKSAVEVLSALAGNPAPDVRALLAGIATKNHLSESVAEWEAALARGFIAGAPLSPVAAVPRPQFVTEAPPSSVTTGDAYDVVFAADAHVHDGAFANNGWLQELPDPVTKLTWDNAAVVSPATAAAIGVSTGDMIELHHANGAGEGAAPLRIPALILPGQPDRVIGLTFGYGRTGAEAVADGVGTNVFRFWPALGDYAAGRVSAVKVAAASHALAITQSHWTMEGRGQARSETLAQHRVAANATARELPVAPPKTATRRPLTIYDPPQRLNAPQQWAMTIDLGTCIGCSACVVACQAENNIPVVGRDDVLKSREMHWMRIDRYIDDTTADAAVVTQPMLCQHCENAPCEYVCPVGATDHSPDGLNEMVYNRCVGTRFCSNNCPYKVRRFNWYDYSGRATETEQMVRNPDVTVRARGVMEKCTFCVQRIREAEISAGVDGQPLRGRDVQTACQQSCPTNAIVFGSLTDAGSDVVRLRQDPRAYSVLAELGTNPRVEYLTRVRNVNPRLEPAT